MKIDVRDLVKRKLVRAKEYTEGPHAGLRVLKYNNKVFYDNLWNVDERLLECRGTVVNQDDETIVLPFRKVFNYKENGTTVDLDEMVTAVPKLNGFMAAITYTKDYGIIYSTTGSLDSEFVEYIKDLTKDEHINTVSSMPGKTFLFEACHPSDPHIIEETIGLHLIGIRDTQTGELVPESFLDSIADKTGIKRSKGFDIRFGDLLELNKKATIEGYMVRECADKGKVTDHLCKLKTPYYLANKFFSRMSPTKVELMFTNPEIFKKTLDEEYYPFVDYIVQAFGLEEWNDLEKLKRLDALIAFYETYNS